MHILWILAFSAFATPKPHAGLLCGYEAPGVSRTPSQQLGDSIPSFGGAFIKEGILHLYIANLEDTVAASRIVHAQLAAQRRANLPVQFVKGRFGYCELYGYMRKIIATEHGFDGVSDVWIDEWTNTLRFGVIDEASRKRLLRLIDKNHFPKGAVSVEIRPYAKV